MRRKAARDEGVDVRAVTAWALLGSYDWDSLVTRLAGHLRARGLRPAIAPAPAHRAGRDCSASWPAGTSRTTRCSARPAGGDAPNGCSTRPSGRGPAAPVAAAPARRAAAGPAAVAIAGATGTLGRAFARLCSPARPAPPAPLADARWTSPTRPPSPRRWTACGPGRSSTPPDMPASTTRSASRRRAAAPTPTAPRSWPPPAPAGASPCWPSRRTWSSAATATSLTWRGTPSIPLNVYGRSKAEMERRVLAALPSALRRADRRLLRPLGRSQLRHARPAEPGRRAALRRGRRRGRLADLRPRPGPRGAGPADRRRARPVAPGQRRRHHLGRAWRGGRPSSPGWTPPAWGPSRRRPRAWPPGGRRTAPWGASGVPSCPPWRMRWLGIVRECESAWARPHRPDPAGLARRRGRGGTDRASRRGPVGPPRQSPR